MVRGEKQAVTVLPTSSSPKQRNKVSEDLQIHKSLGEGVCSIYEEKEERALKITIVIVFLKE